MGRFGQLEKCARSYDASAREYRWSGWRAVSAGGVDYVAESELCVVYRATASYAAEESGLLPFTVATNFVNPHTTGNPSTACCYLYTDDPTQGGSALVSSPPPGYAGCAGPLCFDASTVGDYLHFSFPAMDGRPAVLYFWFTSSGTYASYGSNQIYHYATGNWSSQLQTGTRTPALIGGYSGGSGGESGGGGDESGVSRYTLLDCGSVRNIARTERTFTVQLGKAQVGRMALSFAYAGNTPLTVTGTGDSSMTRIWFSDSPTLDTETGRPESFLYQCDADGTEYTVNLEKGRLYYVFATCDAGIRAGSVRFTFSPPEEIWSVGDSARYDEISGEITRGISLGKTKYSVLELSFAHSGTARFYSDATEIGAYMPLQSYLCESDCIDSHSGVPDPFLAQGHGDLQTGQPPDFDYSFQVSAGKRYFLYTRNYTYSDYQPSQLRTVVHIVPPAEPDGYRLVERTPALDGTGRHSVQERCGRYIVRRQELSFRYRGEMRVTAAATDSTGTPQLRAYLSDSSQVSLRTGVPEGTVCAADGGDASAVSLSCQVREGEHYWLFLTVSEILYETASELVLCIDSPETRVFHISERAAYEEIRETVRHAAAPGESGVCRLELRFAQSGVVRFSSAAAGGELHYLRAALSTGADILPDGSCAGGVLASGSGSAQEKNFAFQAFVEAGKTYYLFCRDDWLYGNAEFDIRISPTPGLVRVQLGGEARGALPFLYRQGSWHAALPMCRQAQRWHTGG